MSIRPDEESMSDAAPSATTGSTDPDADPDADQLDALCRELAEAADAVGEAAHYASRLALGSRLPVTALARGSRRRTAWRTLLRTLTDPAGLGWAPRGRGVARAGWLAGVLARRESLAVSLAVCGLKGRIRVACTRNPGMPADPAAAEVFRAVEEDRQADAVREFRDLMRRQGAGPAFALLNPSFADILAWSALTDDNPLNDHAGWQVATGRAVTAAPFLGLGAAFRAFFDRAPAWAEPEAGLIGELDTTGTAAGYGRNADRIRGTAGAILLQSVIGPDGTERCVVQLAGPPGESGRAGPRHADGQGHPAHADDDPDDAHHPYDTHDAHDAHDEYARTVAATVRRLVPSGTELALVGRGPGGQTAERLATSRDFTTVYPVTRVCPDPESAAALAGFQGRVTASHLVGVPGLPDAFAPGRPR
ncbi:hypothetical protein J7F03_17290 [Streptomyces sp. ISL-43]|uniref:hypothetical protein n=1 Tax=Streptomyces sp. ISL-43 TaxID=2819183 RepID=UPI001BE61362|nr:hypothetical protein [Streptomyces sp. ISL-43]MBT2448814.1 hypothetical protein [Streptomyces sp. ISL-43]